MPPPPGGSRIAGSRSLSPEIRSATCRIGRKAIGWRRRGKVEGRRETGVGSSDASIAGTSLLTSVSRLLASSLRSVFQKPHHQRRPARLVAGAQAPSVVSVEEFVEQGQVAPVRILRIMWPVELANFDPGSIMPAGEVAA